jgi:magnesium chelatase subunit I
MDNPSATSSGPTRNEQLRPTVNSLRELLDLVSGRAFKESGGEGDAGLAEHLPYPFLAITGQTEMKLALLLNLINPAIGGVLLIGPRGTGKTTAVRSLLDLLPMVARSTCFYGCLPEDIEAGGIDAVCPDCARKFAEGSSLTTLDRVRLVELPLNTHLEDVVGRLDDHAMEHERLRLNRGIMAHADQNILFLDEVNLFAEDIIDAILDAAAVGSYTVRKASLAATYRARFMLIGSMNPEEGSLRSQILDRFGLRIIVRGLPDPHHRLEAYRRVKAYLSSPRKMINQYQYESNLALEEIQAARNLLVKVELPGDVADQGIRLIQSLQIDSLRAEITLFEAARAYCAADNRLVIKSEDLITVAPMALRMRRSKFMSEFFSQQDHEETELSSLLNRISHKPSE